MNDIRVQHGCKEEFYIIGYKNSCYQDLERVGSLILCLNEMKSEKFNNKKDKIMKIFNIFSYIPQPHINKWGFLHS